LLASHLGAAKTATGPLVVVLGSLLQLVFNGGYLGRPGGPNVAKAVHLPELMGLILSLEHGMGLVALELDLLIIEVWIHIVGYSLLIYHIWRNLWILELQ
jgi:hypothetical protein